MYRFLTAYVYRKNIMFNSFSIYIFNSGLHISLNISKRLLGDMQFISVMFLSGILLALSIRNIVYTILYTYLSLDAQLHTKQATIFAAKISNSDYIVKTYRQD